jgi:hypothetical protein
MDRRAVRLALGLTIAGASLLTMGVASWLLTAAGRVTSGAAPGDLRLAAVVLLAGGAACGLAMGVAMATAGRAQAGGLPVTAAGFIPGGPESPVAAPWLAAPRSLMNPPPPSPPSPWPQEQAPGDPGPADRVWWRAAHSPASGWDDTSEEWLRSLRGPIIQQPPPHSAE